MGYQITYFNREEFGEELKTACFFVLVVSFKIKNFPIRQNKTAI
jgi:hypothetical protein